MIGKALEGGDFVCQLLKQHAVLWKSCWVLGEETGRQLCVRARAIISCVIFLMGHIR